MKLRKIAGIMLIFLLIIVVPTLLSTSVLQPIGSRYVQVIQGESTQVCGYISENTTWTLAESPYIVVCDVIVEPGAFLTIEPKVMVKFTSGKSLVIFGGLIAQGNTTNKITFTSNSTTPAPADWGTVKFKGSEFLMKHVLIEYADKGLELIYAANISDSLISNSNVGVEGKLSNAFNLTITDNSGDGLRVSNSLVIKNSSVSSNGGHGVINTEGFIINMDGCMVWNNTGNGVDIPSGGHIGNSYLIGNGCNGSCISGPTTIENSEISGNGGDGIWTESDLSIVECHINENGGNGITSSYVDGLLTIQNSNISCNVWDGIRANSSIEISECNVSHNNGSGVVTLDGNMTVSRSYICNNNLSGLSGHGYISSSNVSDNQKWGILGNYTIEYFTNITRNWSGGFNGTGSIYWSSIFDNTFYGGYDAVADIWPNNITAIYNWWGTDDGALIREHIWDHENDSMLGYVEYAPWLNEPPRPRDDMAPKIGPFDLTVISPDPRIPWTSYSRAQVRVSVNVTDNESPMPSGVHKVLLSYRVNATGEWWNTSMYLNETSGNWTTIIPPQPANSIIEFFIQAYDKAGNLAILLNNTEYWYFTVDWLPYRDVNGDSWVDMMDLYLVALDVGEGPL